MINNAIFTFLIGFCGNSNSLKYKPNLRIALSRSRVKNAIMRKKKILSAYRKAFRGKMT